MEQQTAIDWFVEKLLPFQLSMKDHKGTVWHYGNLTDNTYTTSFIEQAKKIEKQRIIDAILYALDEDGHTGDWKIKFANDYYDKISRQETEES